jgi:hypothetical protein
MEYLACLAPRVEEVFLEATGLQDWMDDLVYKV